MNNKACEMVEVVNMVLVDKEIRESCQDKKKPLITPFYEAQLQAASYDVTLSGQITSFKKNIQTIDLKENYAPDSVYDVTTAEEGYLLQPGEYVLAELQETLALPADMIAHIRPRTRFTRLGLLVAGQHCNPAYAGVLRIGVFNASPNAVKLSKGISIAQIVFERLPTSPSEEKLYPNKENAGYMNETGFRGSVLNEKGWSKELEMTYQDLLTQLGKRG